MLVKCDICGEEIESKTAYRVKRRGAIIYYCSKDEYLKNEDDKIRNKKIYDITQVYKEIINVKFLSFRIMEKMFETFDGEQTVEYLDVITDNKEKIKGIVENRIDRDGEFKSVWMACGFVNSIVKNIDKDQKKLAEKQNKANKKNITQNNNAIKAPVERKDIPQSNTRISIDELIAINEPRVQNQTRRSLNDLEDML